MNVTGREHKRGLWFFCSQLPEVQKRREFDLQWFQAFVADNTFTYQKACDHRYVASQLWSGHAKAYYQAAPALLEAFEAAAALGTRTNGELVRRHF